MGGDGAENGNYWYTELSVRRIRRIVKCVVVNWPTIEHQEKERSHYTQVTDSVAGVGSHVGMAAVVRHRHLLQQCILTV